MFSSLIESSRAFLADASTTINQGAAAACGSTCGGSDLGKVLGTIANTLIFLVGAIAVIMIIVGGLRYVLSGGDSKATTDAKNTILYSVVGVVVAVVAFAIVHFVVTNIK